MTLEKIHQLQSENMKVAVDLGVVREYGERAAEEFARKDELKREYKREYWYDLKRRVDGTSWLATMDYHWFKGKPEWQNKWLSNRRLRREWI
jgi:hypothetical protein